MDPDPELSENYDNKKSLEGGMTGAVFRIRIGFGFNQVIDFGSGSRRAKMTHKSRKKIRNFFF